MAAIAPRRATASDAPALNRLAREAYAVYVPVIGREPQPMATDWSTLIERLEIWLVEGAEGVPTASLALDIRNDHLVIWSVAVAPDAQHRGLGRALMSLAERRTTELHLREVRLFTNAKMTRNVDLYRRLGYRETHRETLSDRVLVHMAKTPALDRSVSPAG